VPRYYPLKELLFLRTKEFFREPEAIFWVYVFPILLMVGLGVAFRTGGSAEEVRVDVVPGGRSGEIRKALEPARGLHVEQVSLEEARARVSAGKTDIIIDATGPVLRFVHDPSRSGSEAARLRVNDVLQTASGRKDPLAIEVETITEPGSRYIDWLIPGLVGMNIMGGGLWGLGFVTVDLRMRKLLKRFVATPMRRSDFLLALLGSRLFFLVPEIIVILAAGHLIFGLEVRGSLVSLAAVSLLGAVAFGGLGLLLACRTDKIEVASGLLNLIMLPMWLFSGIFFSSERFPEVMQPFIQALPLTQLNNALRAVILEGSSFAAQWLPALLLGCCAVVSFAAALRWFRWQ
jgi:ABC-type multidrug transport system permease subunit